MFQSFYLHRSVSGMDCTVEFLIAPLCREEPIKKDTCGIYHLKTFEGDFSWFPYDRNSEKSMDSCVLDMVKYMNKYLMPFFERGNCCKSAYDVIADFLRKAFALFETHEHSETMLLTHIDPCIPLKNGDYVKCYEHYRAWESDWLTDYETDMAVSGSDSEYDAEHKKKIEKELAQLREMIMRISGRDMDFISNFIENNEIRNLQNLGLN
ncbi:MAG: hypothetical protein FWH04_09145 [Oscillospiraceae bacterium]|nr:hypothetical protein [Oscillospiraceae bacterium]